jgi:hypothetical protein
VADLHRIVDRDLVVAAVNGGQDSWDAIVERFAQEVWDVIRAHGLDPDVAAGVHRAVWLELADRLHDLGDPSRLREWLTRTASVKSYCALGPAWPGRHHEPLRFKRRRHARVRAALPLTLSVPGDNRLFTGESVNVSLGGLYGWAGIPILSTTSRLLVGIDSGDAVILTDASVVGVRSVRGASAGVHTRFHGLSGTRREALTRLLRARRARASGVAGST